MDRYFNKPIQKNGFDFSALGRAICVVGKSGIGKTWAVYHSLVPHVELTAEILRSKQGTLDFLEKIRGSNVHVILDEYECIHDLIGIGEITEPPTRGTFCVISQIPVKMNVNLFVYEFPVPGPEEIKRIVPGVRDGIAQKCRGDLRIAIQSLTFQGDDQDDFQSPRDFVQTLVSSETTVNPVHFLEYHVQEPGNMTSILHENYIDSKSCRFDVAADYFSASDFFEKRIYDGDWNAFSYYTLYGCILPALEIGHSLQVPLRPGSIWTKYQNACMRSKRIASMSSRVPGKRLSMDELLLLRDYAEKGNVEILKEYKFVPSDMDVINHLSPLRKIKAKNLALLKKSL